MVKYVGREIYIIYQDRLGRFTCRRIRVVAIQEEIVRAFDLDLRAPRAFRMDGILSMRPVVVPT